MEHGVSVDVVDRVEAGKEGSEFLHVPMVDAGDFGDSVYLVLVMSQLMMAFGDADFVVRAVVAVVREQERGAATPPDAPALAIPATPALTNTILLGKRLPTP